MGLYEAGKDTLGLFGRLWRARRGKVAKLEEENRSLREKLDVRESMVFEEPLYWRVREDGQREGPYCPKCWGGEQKMSPVKTRDPNGRWQCFVCESILDKPDYRSPASKQTRAPRYNPFSES